MTDLHVDAAGPMPVWNFARCDGVCGAILVIGGVSDVVLSSTRACWQQRHRGPGIVRGMDECEITHFPGIEGTFSRPGLIYL